MTAKDDRRKTAKGRADQETDVQDGTGPCQATPCGAAPCGTEDTTGCSTCD